MHTYMHACMQGTCSFCCWACTACNFTSRLLKVLGGAPRPSLWARRSKTRRQRICHETSWGQASRLWPGNGDKPPYRLDKRPDDGRWPHAREWRQAPISRGLTSLCPVPARGSTHRCVCQGVPGLAFASRGWRHKSLLIFNQTIVMGLQR